MKDRLGVEVPDLPPSIQGVVEERNNAVIAFDKAAKALEAELLAQPPSPNAIEVARVRLECRVAILRGIETGLESAIQQLRARERKQQSERELAIAEGQARSAETQAASAKAQAESAEVQKDLGRSVRRATWVMAGAIIVQALIAGCMWLYPRAPQSGSAASDVRANK